MHTVNPSYETSSVPKRTSSDPTQRRTGFFLEEIGNGCASIASLNQPCKRQDSSQMSLLFPILPNEETKKTQAIKAGS